MIGLLPLVPLVSLVPLVILELSVLLIQFCQLGSKSNNGAWGITYPEAGFSAGLSGKMTALAMGKTYTEASFAAWSAVIRALIISSSSPSRIASIL